MDVQDVNEVSLSQRHTHTHTHTHIFDTGSFTPLECSYDILSEPLFDRLF